MSASVVTPTNDQSEKKEKVHPLAHLMEKKVSELTEKERKQLANFDTAESRFSVALKLRAIREKNTADRIVNREQLRGMQESGELTAEQERRLLAIYPPRGSGANDDE